VSAAATTTERPCSAVDADHEDDARPLPYVQDVRLAEQRGRFVDERLGQVAGVATRFQPAHDLGGRGYADVGPQQRLLEPLPGEVVAGVEGGDLDLLGQRAARLRERVAQARE